jgi:hypothetical protein
MSGDNKKVVLDNERSMIVLQATWEIDALAVLIINALANEHEEVVFAAHGVTKRIKQLNSMIMSAIGDEAVDNESLRKIA